MGGKWMSLSKNARYRYLFFKIDKEKSKIVNVHDIIMIEKIGKDESLVTCKKSEFIIKASLNEIMELLEASCIFFRSHRSYIVNLDYIDKLSNLGNYSEINFSNNNKKALMSKQKKQELLSLNIIGII